MSHDLPDPVTDILRERDGVPTIAHMTSGHIYTIHKIAWGRDVGDSQDHITTNISPSPGCEHAVDFFMTDKVASLVAPESGAVLYRKAPGEA